MILDSYLLVRFVFGFRLFAVPKDHVDGHDRYCSRLRHAGGVRRGGGPAHDTGALGHRSRSPGARLAYRGTCRYDTYPFRDFQKHIL